MSWGYEFREYVPVARKKSSARTLAKKTAKRAGRDPGEIQITTGIDPADPLNSALRLADMGIDRVVVPTAPFRKDIPGGLERFAAEVIAPLRERLG